MFRCPPKAPRSRFINRTYVRHLPCIQAWPGFTVREVPLPSLASETTAKPGKFPFSADQGCAPPAWREAFHIVAIEHNGVEPPCRSPNQGAYWNWYVVHRLGAGRPEWFQFNLTAVAPTRGSTGFDFPWPGAGQLEIPPCLTNLPTDVHCSVRQPSDEQPPF